MSALKKPNDNKSLLLAIDELGLNMSMEELGVKLGFSKSTISKYLSGNLPPSDKFLRKFQTVFNVNLGQIKNSPPLKTENPLPQKMTNEVELLKNYVETLKEFLSSKDEIINLQKNEIENLRNYPNYANKKTDTG